MTEFARVSGARRADGRSIGSRITIPPRPRPGRSWQPDVGTFTGSRVACLLALAVLVRFMTFGNPIVHVDEQFYFATARAMLDGALPYVEVWDRKPIGLFLLYLPAAAAGMTAGIWVYQAMALAAVVATATMIARLADRAGWHRGALAAGALYVVWLNFAEGQGGQAPVFYNALVAGAALLASPSHNESGSGWRGVGAMALIGIALQIKYSVVFEGIGFGLWLLWADMRGGASVAALVRRAVVLAGVALLPTIMAAVFYGAIGQEDAFVYANFVSILQRHDDPLFRRYANLAKIALILGPLIAMGVAGRRPPSRDAVENRQRRLLWWWLGAAVAGLLIFGSWFDHYSLPVMVPAAACAAGFLHRRGLRWALPLVVLAAIGGQGVIAAKRAGRGTPAEFGDLAAVIGRGPGCLYVYSGEPMLYPMTGRCTLTRYLFPSHLDLQREEGAIGADQAAEVRRILSLRPAIVVMRPRLRNERAEIRRMVQECLRRSGYRVKAVVPLGDKLIEIFAAPAVAAPSAG